jgi:prevent-host-death family protein
MTNMSHSSSPRERSRSRSIADAKARFAECLRQAESGEPIVLTRHGKAIAALVPIDLLEQLERLRAAGPEGGLASVAGGWKGSEEVAERAVAYGRSAGRETPDPD